MRAVDRATDVDLPVFVAAIGNDPHVCAEHNVAVNVDGEHIVGRLIRSVDVTAQRDRRAGEHCGEDISWSSAGDADSGERDVARCASVDRHGLSARAFDRRRRDVSAVGLNHEVGSIRQRDRSTREGDRISAGREGRIISARNAERPGRVDRGVRRVDRAVEPQQARCGNRGCSGDARLIGSRARTDTDLFDVDVLARDRHLSETCCRRVADRAFKRSVARAGRDRQHRLVIGRRLHNRVDDQVRSVRGQIDRDL